MKYWQRFTTFKQRGEWVELKFMTEVAQRRFGVSKPWGETRAYDVGVERGQNFLRVQVKCTTYRVGAGYLCKFVPDVTSDQHYSIEQLDLFAAYVIPEDVWYLIPAVLLVGKRRRSAALLCPVVPPTKKACYRYECYRESWNLLTKSRSELLEYANEV
jgi:hypothetical protein